MNPSTGTPSTGTLVAGTTPYAWPWDGDLRRSRLALVVAGWDPHWGAALAPGDDPARRASLDGAVANIERLAAAVDCVVALAHPPLPRPPRGLASATPSPASPTPPSILPPTAVTIAVGGIDGFHHSNLEAFLRRSGRDQLLVVGLGLETTVHSTLRSANDRGLECLVVVDACAPLDPPLVPRSVSMIEMSGGIFGAVGTTDAVLAALAHLSPPATPAGTPATDPIAHIAHP